jgi:hypothetical protein
MMSQTTYMSDMTPMNSTKYLRAMPPATNQKTMMRADMRAMVVHALVSLRQHMMGVVGKPGERRTPNFDEPTIT